MWKVDGEGEKETASSPARRMEVELAWFIGLNAVDRGAPAAVAVCSRARARVGKELNGERKGGSGLSAPQMRPRRGGTWGQGVGAGAPMISSSTRREREGAVGGRGRADRRAPPGSERGGRKSEQIGLGPKGGRRGARGGLASRPKEGEGKISLFSNIFSNLFLI